MSIEAFRPEPVDAPEDWEETFDLDNTTQGPYNNDIAEQQEEGK